MTISLLLWFVVGLLGLASRQAGKWLLETDVLDLLSSGVLAKACHNADWILGFPWGNPKSSIFNGIFPYKPSSYWGSPMAMETPICNQNASFDVLASEAMGAKLADSQPSIRCPLLGAPFGT